MLRCLLTFAFKRDFARCIVYAKPLPPVLPETAPFWEAAKRHQLIMQYCMDCAAYYFYPRMYCPSCMSDRVEWRPVSGRGNLYTFVINHRPAPGFENDAPYVMAVVELEEGARIFSNIVGIENPTPEKLPLDAPVEVVWDDVTPEISLPKFRLA